MDPVCITCIVIVSFLLSLSFSVFTEGRGKLADFLGTVQLIVMDSTTSTHNEKSFTLLKYLNAEILNRSEVCTSPSTVTENPRQVISKAGAPFICFVSLCYLSPCVCTASFTMSSSLAQDRSANDKQ